VIGATNAIYRIDSIDVDVSLRCLRRDGSEHHLRPKSFQVLVYLIERRPNLVTKEELIERLWADTAVTDDAIVQCITDARKVLGDDSRNPRFVKTVPKVGYRFIGPVEVVYPEMPAASGDEDRAIAAEGMSLAGGDAEAEGPSVAAGHGGVEPVRPAPRPPAARRFSTAALAALLLAAAALFLAPTLRNSLRPRADVVLPHFPGKKSVAVMYFENQSGTQELDWLREGLADMFITNLSRFPALTVLGRQHLHQLRERVGLKKDPPALEDILEIARRSHAELIVLGSFARLGEKTRVTAAFHEAGTGRLVAAESLTVERVEQILTRVDMLSTRLAARVGATPADAGAGRTFTDVTTNNLEAYRYYSLAIEKAHTLQTTEAIDLLRKAVALDPEFAMAHAGIGYVYAVAWAFGDEARPHLEQAFRLTHRLTEKDRLYVTAWYAIAQLDYPGAVRILRQIVAQYPLEVEAYLRLGRLLAGEQQMEAAVDVLRAGLAVDPDACQIHNALGSTLSELGRHDEAIAALQHGLGVAPDVPNTHDNLGLSYQWAGRYDSSMREYERASALDPQFELARKHRANLYFQLGRYRDAIREFQWFLQKPASDLERGVGYGAIAWIHLRKGDLDRAAEAVRRQRAYFPEFAGEAAMLALARRDLAAAERLYPDVSRDWPYTNRGARQTPRFQHYYAGQIALKCGRHAEALAALKQAVVSRPPFWSIDTFEDCLADAYLELGRLDEAIREYGAVLRLNPNYALARYHLGRAYEMRGQLAAARGEYERFLGIWKDADPDIPELIDAKRRCSKLSRTTVSSLRNLSPVGTAG
jgi:tetratricopeptide (TPR) repeat protein/DNA-binding winged helix-turn-helix (wHTH) protein/TolB-like protein